jgi:hypothetical protein
MAVLGWRVLWVFRYDEDIGGEGEGNSHIKNQQSKRGRL